MAACVLSLLNDIGFTIVQASADEAQLNDTTDGLAIACLILWIPSFTINFLHLKNIRMQKKKMSQATHLQLPLTGSVFNQIGGTSSNKANMSLYEAMLSRTHPDGNTGSSFVLEGYGRQ